MEQGIIYTAVPPEAKSVLDLMLSKAHAKRIDPDEAVPFLAILLPPVLGPSAGRRGLFLFVYPDATHSLVLLTEEGDRDRVEASVLRSWLYDVTGLLGHLQTMVALAEKNERPDYYPELTGRVKHDA